MDDSDDVEDYDDSTFYDYSGYSARSNCRRKPKSP